MNDGCGERRIALGAYALGALEPEERAAIETHLAGCAGCREELAGLNRRFGDIVDHGVLRLTDPLPPERTGNDHLELPRVALRFDRVHYGRLRLLIDALNECTG